MTIFDEKIITVFEVIPKFLPRHCNFRQGKGILEGF